MHDESDKDPKVVTANLRAVRKGLIDGLTGLVLSVLLSIVIVAGLLFQWPPFKFIERLGTDVSFRLLSEYPPDLGESEGDTQPPQKPAPRYIFFDIGLDTCQKFATQPAYCQTQNPVSARALQALTTQLITSGARAIVIDSQIDLDNPEDAALVDSLIALSIDTPNSPAILIPLDVRGDNAVTSGQPIYPFKFHTINYQWFDASWLANHRLYQSKVRIAPAIMSNDVEAADGKIRNIQRFLSIDTGHGYVTLPNMPYLIATINESADLRKVDCRYFTCDKDGSAEGMVRKAPVPAELPFRIIYTLPALSRSASLDCGISSATDPVHRKRCKDKLEKELAFQHIYVYESAAVMLEGEKLAYDSAVLKDSVILLGSSLASGRDLHLTPTGIMSGAEITINSAHSFDSFYGVADDYASRDFGVYQALQTLWTKITAAASAAILITAAFVVSHLINVNLSFFWRPWRDYSILGFLLTTATVVATFVFSVQIELSNGLNELYESTRRGVVIDILTPIVALLVERYTEIAKSILDTTEHRVAGTVNWVGKVIKQKFRLKVGDVG